jgi:RHS repeat-associated protein
VRAQTGDTATDRGFLGQIEDSSTNLSYLNARYYDAAAGVFISADPVYNPSKPKTINPYAYSVNNPTTYSDPGGAYSTHTFALERANAALTAQVRKLIGHVKQLNGAIAELQDYIREQQSYIKDLLTYIDALEAEIARQLSYIRKLEARIADLQRTVSALRAENSRLRAHIAAQDRVIRYYQGIVNVLGFRLWGGTPHFERVMFSIHSFQGIPAGAFAVDNISILEAKVADLSRRMGGLRAARDSLSESAQTQRQRAVAAEARVDEQAAIIDGLANGQAAQRNRMRELEIRVELGDFAYEIYLEGPQESPYKSCSLIEQLVYWGVDQISTPHAPGSAPGSPSALDAFCTEPAPIPAA